MRQSGLDNKARPLVNPDEFMGLIRRGIVREVTTERDIVVEFGSGTNAGNRVTIPSTRVYTFSGRYRELPHVGDTCIIAFVNGRPDDAVILGFNSGEAGEHDSFEDVEDRRLELPGLGKVFFGAQEYQTNMVFPASLIMDIKGSNPGVELKTDGGILAIIKRTFQLIASRIIANISGSVTLNAGDIVTSFSNIVVTGKESSINLDKVNTAVTESIIVECDNIHLGDANGKRAARVGDKIIIPKGTAITITNGLTDVDMEGIISENETNGSSKVRISD